MDVTIKNVPDEIVEKVKQEAMKVIEHYLKKDVRVADEAYHIGESNAAKSYLNMEKIIFKLLNLFEESILVIS